MPPETQNFLEELLCTSKDIWRSSLDVLKDRDPSRRVFMFFLRMLEASGSTSGASWKPRTFLKWFHGRLKSYGDFRPFSKASFGDF